MSLTGRYESIEAWQQYAEELEAEAQPDTGVIDGICSPGTIVVLSISSVPDDNG